MVDRNSRLSDAHLARIREVVHPGIREVEVSADELVMMLDEIEQHRIPVLDLDHPDPEARTKTIPSADSAMIRYRAMLTAHAEDMPDGDEGPYPMALGFFLGLGLDLATARHLALRV